MKLAGASAGAVPVRAIAPGRPWPLWVETVAALAAGLLHAQAFAPEPRAWLQLLCVVWLAWRSGHQTPGRAGWLGGVFSTAWLTGGTWWMFISLHRYGGLPAWMAALAVLALCAFLSLYLAAAMAAWVRWRPRRPLADAALFAAVWLLAELARGVIFTGFPWIAAGYAHVDGALAALAPWIGVYGLGAVAAAVAALVAGVVRSAGRRWSVLAVAAVLWWAPLALPHAFSAPSGSLSVALLQTNVPQDEKFAAEHQAENLDWTVRTLLDTQAELLVAPETAIPLLPEQLPDGFWDAFRRPFTAGDRALLVGLPLGDFKRGYTNSVAGLSRDAASQPGAFDGFYRYDKHHLVPFGEFIPLGFRWFVDLMNMPLGDFDRGPVQAPSFAVRTPRSIERVAPNICYEDLFGEDLAVRFIDPTQAPTVFANVSNIAWFGDTVAIDQHLQISRMRALELQRPMVRATNTGATAVVDHTGRVTALLPRFTRGVLRATVEGRTGLTPFVRWASRFGLWPLATLSTLVLLVAVVSARRRERRTART